MALPLLPIAVGLQAAGSLAGGIAGVRAANAVFTDEEERRLKRLQRMQQQGQLGLRPEQRAAVRSEALQGYRQDVAEQQAQMNQALQSSGASPRDVYLARRMAQGGALQARAQAGADARAADATKAAEQRAAIRSLEADEAARKSGRAAAIGGAVAGATSAAAQAVQAKYQVQAAKDLQAEQATMLLREQKALDDQRRAKEQRQSFADAYNRLFTA
jgi:colicin import membrane protein